MKVFNVLVSSAVLSFGCCQAEEYVYGKDPKKDAEYDIQTGMAGIQQAAKDPKLLAQLFQDMQVRRLTIWRVKCDDKSRAPRLAASQASAPAPSHPAPRFNRLNPAIPFT